MAAALAVPGTASAATPPAAPPVVPAAQSRCTVDDPRLVELSGLVTDDRGLWAMVDGGRQVRVYRLDPASCAALETRTADIDPSDSEDLARGPDGSLWVGDIGDNDRRRSTVAVVVLPATGAAQLHRLSYPDGPHDAEALLVDPLGRPVVVTKEVGRPAGIYRTETRPDGSGPIPLERVGELALPPSDTPGGPIGGLGSQVVTGAAATRDGAVVALRSYTDAWLYRVSDGDTVAALTGTPLRVPLPMEPQGEAIAFDRDGALFSGSEGRGGVRGELRVVPGAAGMLAAVVDPAPDAAPTAEGQAPPEPAPEWLPAAIGAAAVAALLVLLTGALAIRAARRR